MKKVIIIAILSVSLVVGNLTIYTQVKAETGVGTGIIVQPMFTNINAFNNAFDITAYGEAQMFSYISIRDADQATVSVYLERYNNGTWSPVSNWYSSEYALNTSVSATYNVTSGQYRLRSTGCAYDNGRLVELVSYTSYVVTY